MRNKQYRSNIMAAVHGTAEDLYGTGLMDKCSMREFDELCLSVSHITKADDNIFLDLGFYFSEAESFNVELQKL